MKKIAPQFKLFLLLTLFFSLFLSPLISLTGHSEELVEFSYDQDGIAIDPLDGETKLFKVNAEGKAEGQGELSDLEAISLYVSLDKQEKNIDKNISKQNYNIYLLKNKIKELNRKLHDHNMDSRTRMNLSKQIKANKKKIKNFKKKRNLLKQRLANVKAQKRALEREYPYINFGDYLLNFIF